MRISLCLLALLTLYACAFADKGVVVHQEPIDGTYTKQKVTVRILRSGEAIPYESNHFVKIAEKDGMLLVCGARIGSPVPHVQKWYHAAEIYVGDTENRVASARLLGILDANAHSSIWQATCIKTEAKKIDADKVRSTPVGIVGPRYMSL